MRALLIKSKRLIQLYGDGYVGRTPVVTNTLRFLLERKPNHFRDGFYLIDLEAITQVKALVKAIVDSMQLASFPSNNESLFRDISSKSAVLVFLHCDAIFNSAKHQMLHFLKQLVFGTSSDLKLIVITSDRKHIPLSGDFDVHIELKPMERQAKIKLFQMQMQEQSKMDRVAGIDLNRHEIWDVIDYYFISYVVHNISVDKDLNYWHEHIKAHFEGKRPEQKNTIRTFKRQLSRDSGSQSAKNEMKDKAAQDVMIRSLFLAKIFEQVPTHFNLERNIIFFLSLTPSGMSERELD